MSTPKRGLGRGLGALIPTEPDARFGGDALNDAALRRGDRPRDVFFSDTGAAPRGAGETIAAPTERDGLRAVPGATFAFIDPA